MSDEGTITLTFGSKQFYWLLLAEPDTVSTATSAIPIIRGLGGANDGDAA